MALTGYVGILGGGPIYMRNPTYIKELKTAGFTELLIWSVEVKSNGDLNLNGEFPLTSNGKYIGDQLWPQFAHDLRSLKSGKVQRITLSIGSSNFGDFQNLKALVDSQGTGKKSILYKDFAALAKALPVDAIDLDDENGRYDARSTIKFALMLGKLGYHVTMNPYTNHTYWTVAGIADQHPDAGPRGRHPSICRITPAAQGEQILCVQLGFRRCAGLSPACPTSRPHRLTNRRQQAEAQLESWDGQCGITGAWLWIYDQIKGTTDLPRQYAKDMKKGVNGE